MTTGFGREILDTCGLDDSKAEQGREWEATRVWTPFTHTVESLNGSRVENVRSYRRRRLRRARVCVCQKKTTLLDKVKNEFMKPM